MSKPRVSRSTQTWDPRHRCHVVYPTVSLVMRKRDSRKGRGGSGDRGNMGDVEWVWVEGVKEIYRTHRGCNRRKKVRQSEGITVHGGGSRRMYKQLLS